MPETRLAFVDLETTGLSPGAHRVIEIGVVTVDGDRGSEWSTLINPGVRVCGQSRFFSGIGSDVIADAPRFKDIAPALFSCLEGRLFIAHNARFDHAFLKAEFKRAGIEFYPQVVCSVMLSRKLYSMFARHDLDSLMERHGLTAAVRHRALPDAQLIRQFWEVLHREHPREAIETAIDGLLASPVLPQHLDPALIDRLPEASGVYVLHGEDNHVLHVGKANNLKSHVQNYFRLDRTSAKALAISHRITNITWRVTLGTLGAQLQHAALLKALLPARKALAGKSAALKPLQLPAWPYAGPIGVRERADLHIIDDWRYLGTANCEADVYSVLQTRPPDFDEEIFALLAKRLPRLSHKQIIQLPGHERTL